MKNKLKKWTDSLSLSKKIAASLVFAMLLVLSLTAGILYGSALENARQLNARYIKRNLEITTESIERLLLESAEQAKSLLYQQELRRLLLSGTVSIQNNSQLYGIMAKEASRLMAINSALRVINLYKEDGCMSSWRGTVIDQYLQIENYGNLGGLCTKIDQYCGENASDRNSSFWLYPVRDISGNMHFFIHVQMLRNIYAGQRTAAVAMYLDESAFYQQYAYVGADSFILSKNGIILSAADKSLIGEILADEGLRGSVLSLNGQSGSFAHTLAGSQKYLSAAFIPELSAYLVAIPSDDAGGSRSFMILPTVILVFVFGITFAVFLGPLLARSLTKQINRLKFSMEQAWRGDFSERFVPETKDEIAYLGNTYNMLLDSVEAYVDTIRRHERQEKSNEVRLLQAQINPHLLYNSLDSLQYMLIQGETQLAEQALHSISEFFKLSLRKGSLLATINEELLHVEQYKAIQRMCRGKQVDIITNCEPDLQEHPIIKMTLQPIVENAFVHGFTGEVNEGVIHIDIQTEDKLIRIEITDDGNGMDEAALACLRNQLTMDSCEGGFGLWNVNRRLKHHYGESYGLKIDSEFGFYTRVTIHIPINSGEERACSE